MGAERVVTVDLHTGQIQGFFRNIPVDNLYAEGEFLKLLKEEIKGKEKILAIVAPNARAVAMARRVADYLKCTRIISLLPRRLIDSERVVESLQLVGDVSDVQGKFCILVDDMIDTAISTTKSARLLAEYGAASVIALATHGIFSPGAIERVNASNLTEVLVTDSLPQEENQKNCSKLRVISIAHLLATAISRLHDEHSLSDLFEKSIQLS